MRNPLLSRREMLSRAGCGFGSLAFAAMAASQGYADPLSSAPQTSPLSPKPTSIPARAKRIIFIFMQGGPSHMDTFDYKPELFKSDGKEIDFTGVRFGTFGKDSKRKLMKPLWDFKQYGECGQSVSSLFPNIAEHVDDLCFLKGLHTEGVAHGPSTLFLHTGATNLVRPSMGSWVTYGLGTENQDLPGFVTVGPSATKGGPRNYSNGFLPAVYQGTALGRAEHPETYREFQHIDNETLSTSERLKRFEMLRRINEAQRKQRRGDDQLEATIESYELAFRMQKVAPGVLDISDETDATRKLYGLDEKQTRDFGLQCLLGRRMAEAGVRYIQLNYADESTNPPWDQHSNMPAHEKHAWATDKPVAGLLADLKQRGLLEDTLVWWGGEFGRTPFSQNNNGRDHNPRGFTVFLAGGGVKPGFSYGETDEIGHHAVEGKMHMHDLHATILNLMGLDHEQLTYRYAGRDFRLTDVSGRVVKDIFA